ncbi:hypothetical protein [Actinomadura alba]|uniref:Lipoprotein n=1 Tax=Actinomadura alba TaxID=406431 RepID=A0ABR7LZA2_9ACTN|nr:hypothetical protein [Actinomadura alba]MBC6470192.1 hypothetical protein [Actinomadura alba]
MTIPKSISMALSTMACAGIAVFTSGAMTPASAQTVAAAAEQPAVVQGCNWRWGNCHHNHWPRHHNWHQGHHGHHGHHHGGFHGHHHGGWR